MKKNEIQENFGYGQIGDQWLRENGYVDNRVHQTLGLTIKSKFPYLRNFEYMCDSKSKKVQVYLYVSLLSKLFRNHSKMVDFVYELLLENLPEYQVAVVLKRYKGGTNATKNINSITNDVANE